MKKSTYGKTATRLNQTVGFGFPKLKAFFIIKSQSPAFLAGQVNARVPVSLKSVLKSLEQQVDGEDF